MMKKYLIALFVSGCLCLASLLWADWQLAAEKTPARPVVTRFDEGYQLITPRAKELFKGPVKITPLPEPKPVYPELDNFDQEAIGLIKKYYYTKSSRPQNFRLSEAFMLYRIIGQGSDCDSMAIEWRENASQKSAEEHNRLGSTAYFKNRNGCFNVTTSPTAQAIVIAKDKWPRWVIEAGKDKLLVEWMSKYGNYHQAWVDKNQFYNSTDGKVIYLKPRDYRAKYTQAGRGYIKFDRPILQGYPDKTIRPYDNVTRAELTTALVRVLKLSKKTDKANYTDTSGHWAESAIAGLSKTGIVGGYSDGSFRPNKQVTNIELFKVLTNIWSYLGYKYSTSDSGRVFGLQADYGAIEAQQSGRWRSFERGGGIVGLPKWGKNSASAGFPLLKDGGYAMNGDLLPSQNINQKQSGSQFFTFWNQPIKRYQMARLLNILTGRGQYKTVKNRYHFDDLPSSFMDRGVDSSPEMIMTVAAMDIEEMGVSKLYEISDYQLNKLTEIRSYQSKR